MLSYTIPNISRIAYLSWVLVFGLKYITNLSIFTFYLNVKQYSEFLTKLTTFWMDAQLPIGSHLQRVCEMGWPPRASI